MKKKIYNWCTLWLTLSVIFFLAEYASEWLEVVTLGGLALGSFIEGLIVNLGLSLMSVLASKKFLQDSWREIFSKRSDLLKALVIVAAFAWEGVLMLTRMLPGYTLHSSAPHLIFLLLLYPLAAIILKIIIQERGGE